MELQWDDEPTVADEGSGWRIDDEVTRLREWGTEVTHTPPVHGAVIGSLTGCGIRLADPTGTISRSHARIDRVPGGWIVRDLESKNGTWIDGVRCAVQRLEPGAELRVGGCTLIAESRWFCELGRLLARLIGWGPDHVPVVDRALRSVRIAATRHLPLVLCGHGDLCAVAESIHRLAIGSRRPFVVCDSRRRDWGPTVRSPGNRQLGMEALRRAHGGSLCVWCRRLPVDYHEVRRALADPRTQALLIVCSESAMVPKPYRVEPIVIPELEQRTGDIERIVDECADDAAAILGATDRLDAADKAFVRRFSAESITAIDKGARRLLAIRMHDDNIAAAAKHLGMAPVSLARWLDRRVAAHR